MALQAHLASVTLVLVLLGSGMSNAEPLAGSEWKPTCLKGRGLSADLTAFIQFRGGGRLLGHGGCNRLFGEYRLDGRKIRIGPLSSTRKACDAERMQQEQALMETLHQAHSYRRARTRLVLSGDDNLPLLELRQTDWD